ncbi:hypothetical protein, conserved [Plasmodium gonderi]|uniref:Uncharacterized protein n=1 Tax=Plasmodium gonderi TaxID=77519 RepID=A0A1Y1JR28_PLAGO|nr:hypothetical protein, conserved [Plasmodium gonderi]GAW83282.1 hypothetical protein, conserved [Plasmodium gonderi]
MDTCDNKLNVNYLLNKDKSKKKKRKEEKYIEIFCENDSDLYSPCIDMEGALCVISEKGEIFRYKLENSKGDRKGMNISTAASSSDDSEDGEDSNDEDDIDSKENDQSDEHDEKFFDFIHGEQGVINIRKKSNIQKVQQELYMNTDIATECLCADNDYNFYVFDPMTGGLMVINKKKEIELYTDEYEDQSFKGVNNLIYDKKKNLLYVVDSGNINEENKCNLFYINKDIETMISIDIPNIPYVHNICVYQKDNINDIYVCLTKENKIVRLIKKGNSYIKCHFLHLNGCYSPLFICTNNKNFVVLLKDLSDCEKKGKLLEINSNAQVINSFFMNGNQFNGICYDENVKKYFFIEKNIIYMY